MVLEKSEAITILRIKGIPRVPMKVTSQLPAFSFASWIACPIAHHYNEAKLGIRVRSMEYECRLARFATTPAMLSTVFVLY